MLSNRTSSMASGAPVPSRRGSARHALLAAVAVGAAIVLSTTSAGAAQAPVGLGTSGSFGVLAGSGITNTGPTVITGDIGSFPTPSETGLGSVVLTGTDHRGDAVTQQAKTDLTTAYNVAAAATPTTSVPAELGGTTLTPGVYNGATLQITGTLTLNTGGDPNAVFIFQTASTLVTASNSSVIVLNGGRACNVFWQVSSSATLGTGSALIGTVLASTSITASTRATVQGRLLAQNGAVTLDTNTITNQGCAQPTTTTTTPASTTAAPTASTTTAAPTTTTTTTAAPTTTTTTAAPTTTTTTPVSTPTTLGPGSQPPSSGTKATIPASTTGPGSAGRPPGTTAAVPTSGSPATPGAPAGPLTARAPRPVPSTPPHAATPGTPTPVPPLPFTGSGPLLPIVGGLTLALGLCLLGLSKLRRPVPSC